MYNNVVIASYVYHCSLPCTQTALVNTYYDDPCTCMSVCIIICYWVLPACVMSGEALSDELVNDFHLIMAVFGHYQHKDAKYKMIMVITLL